MKRSEAITLVKSHQTELLNLGVKSLSLFGSVARDQANSKSDIDILVELDRSIGFFEFFQIKHYLEKILDASVDLGTVEALKEHARQPILDDLIHVF
ncbi:nucleotidyltransferase family protein [Synechococcus elongatus IITB4]|uniref:nucleotidyltransferase family protein n=1 Tax=Synechococcus elongatus TaxID=32046 RepID=UPI0030CDEAB0